jgi:hypothetical protein
MGYLCLRAVLTLNQVTPDKPRRKSAANRMLGVD